MLVFTWIGLPLERIAYPSKDFECMKMQHAMSFKLDINPLFDNIYWLRFDNDNFVELSNGSEYIQGIRLGYLQRMK